ncbi:MAG: sugar ABC transporter permease [Clostridia bacterium]|nr:sugar ABC transporter permease [Clostridia bacterium]MBQ4326943.1 sugar ABC transporter permease [Clostridia bacterium]
MTNTANVTNAAPKKRRRAASLDRRKARAGWVFVLPFVLGFVIIYLPIIFNSIRLSFFELESMPGGALAETFVGFANYNEALFVNPDFVSTLIAGLGRLAFDIPAIVIFSLFMAVLLNQKMVGRAAFRAIFFIPVILSTGIMASIDQGNILASYGEEGVSGGQSHSASSQIVSMLDVEVLFDQMKVGREIVGYVIGIVNSIYDIVNRSGVQMLIFLAGLQSISPAIYESCQIEGASAWETFWKITLPMISPMILVNAIYTVIDSFTAGSNTVMRFIEQEYSTKQGVISTAMAWMYFILVILIVAVVALILGRFVFYQRRD